VAMKSVRLEASFTFVMALSRAGVERSIRATPAAPSRAKAIEVARPIPDAAPVTTWPKLR
jgi:hypothetical protein